MKKQLLTSSAIVAAGVFALAPGALAGNHAKSKSPFITVNGYHEQILGAVVDEDENVAGVGDKSFLDVHHETEIHFNGHVKLDNGITMRAHTELEANSDQGGGDYIDEVYLIVRGSFGQITIGSEDSAAHLMLIGFSGSWATGVGQNLTFDSAEWVTSLSGDFGTTRDSRLTAQDGDAEKITYYTPRFNGFQLGASYIPGSSANEDQNGVAQTADTDYHDGISLGMNYVGKAGGVGIAGGVGYVQQQAPENLQIGTATAVVDDDVKQVAAALRLDFGPIRLSGVVKRVMSNETGGTDQRGRIIDTGMRYTDGPNMFSITYAHGERSVGSSKYEAGMASYAKNLGPGVRWHANVIWSDSTNAAGTLSNDGIAVSTGIRLSF